ncbi:hypothetical protein FLONG3_9379 [Fusarium longipes]|uniref:Peptidase A1 domain-containing protein n=1 Tax=Fusarium longipes TaxID=694270 RepID=A0A395RYD2_9HYPO|nr:hypothetical protein FLONG3_9379 [Fusarium longipes]
MRSSIFAFSLFFAHLIQAALEPEPVLLPTGDWTGTDGNWSTISFYLGSNSQHVDVLVSTALSEFWAVGPGGCLPKEPHCSVARGGIYDAEDSSDWNSLGTWQLGLSYLGYGGNGEYGRDLINTQSPLKSKPFTMNGVLIATINTTSYLHGLFGLGITQGNFNGTVAESPLTQAVSEYGLIPSYSFGYTAGAHYRNLPASLTLGGVVNARFQPHNNVFTLPQDDNMERPLVRGIEMTPAEGRAPDSWDAEQLLLSQWNTSFYAIIDSTTSYLWLPEDVCDQFAQALNLTYNSTFDLYTISDDQYREYSKEESFNVTFILSSFDDNDDFGDPYDVSGIVNITLPLRAFVGLLQYPFMPDTIEYGDPAIPYFMLRKAQNSTTYILGRSFLQESYLITKYDEGTFSIHQALFPDGPVADTELSAIEQSSNSPYPPPKAQGSSKGLSSAQAVGIGVGVGLGTFFVCAIAFLIWRYCRKRKGTARNDSALADNQRGSPGDSPRSLLVSLFSKITGRVRSSGQSQGAGDNEEKVVEAPDNQIHEMSAPLPPVELDADDCMSWNDDTELGTDNSNNLSAYEIARRKLDRQLQGPVPSYSPPANGAEIPPEKAIYQPNPANCPPTVLQLSPSASLKVSPEGESNANSMVLPSPLTPRFDPNGRLINALPQLVATMPVSPTTDSIPSLNSPLSPHSDERTRNPTIMDSNREHQPSSNPSVNIPQQRLVQRTPIDSSRVVLLGALPPDARFSRNTVPQNSSDEHHQGVNHFPHGNATSDSLGSNFTVDEEAAEPTRRLDLGTNGSSIGAAIANSQQGHSADNYDTARGSGRINPGEDLVHVPQLAERRYSWEE